MMRPNKSLYFAKLRSSMYIIFAITKKQSNIKNKQTTALIFVPFYQ